MARSNSDPSLPDLEAREAGISGVFGQLGTYPWKAHLEAHAFLLAGVRPTSDWAWTHSSHETTGRAALGRREREIALGARTAVLRVRALLDPSCA